MPANQPLLELRNVTCERDDAPLFEPISLVLSAGDIVQLEGANGVGKTTLLRCIGGLSSRWDGEMLWRGEAVARRRAEFAAATIYLGHAIGLKAALSARENLHWWVGLRGFDCVEAIDRALERVGLLGYEDSPCYQLSAGQQRRVGLARLFLTDAPLWILDEPFTAIDRRGVAELERWIAAHAEAGGAVLLTSHQSLSLPQLRSIALQIATSVHAEASA
ncbi:MAG: cytochrome c biogenesis heme-transporting ATPase CcmA [Spongiibacteraceae bacterium]